MNGTLLIMLLPPYRLQDNTIKMQGLFLTTQMSKESVKLTALTGESQNVKEYLAF